MGLEKRLRKKLPQIGALARLLRGVVPGRHSASPTSNMELRQPSSRRYELPKHVDLKVPMFGAIGHLPLYGHASTTTQGRLRSIGSSLRFHAVTAPMVACCVVCKFTPPPTHKFTPPSEHMCTRQRMIRFDFRSTEQCLSSPLRPQASRG